MPFVNTEHRLNPDRSIPGDRCYLHYRWMMNEWKKEPRWTTADRIYDSVMRDETSLEEQRAKELAWQVFFNLHVMPYELQKIKEHGDIL